MTGLKDHKLGWKDREPGWKSHKPVWNSHKSGWKDRELAERIREEADRYVARRLWGTPAAPEPAPVLQTHLERTISAAKEAYCEAEGVRLLTRFEFLMQQSRYIRKRWWVLQGILLFLAGGLLLAMDDSAYMARCLGALGPAFAVLILPELWRNRNVGSMEVEATAYYNLRQVYAARLTLFAMADSTLLSVFIGVASVAVRIPPFDLATQFLLPFTVACGICFTAFYGRRFRSEGAALLLCGFWILIWVRVVLEGGLYEKIAPPVWCGALALAAAYLFFCVARGQMSLERQWEEEPAWN